MLKTICSYLRILFVSGKNHRPLYCKTSIAMPKKADHRIDIRPSTDEESRASNGIREHRTMEQYGLNVIRFSTLEIAEFSGRLYGDWQYTDQSLWGQLHPPEREPLTWRMKSPWEVARRETRRREFIASIMNMRAKVRTI